MALTDKLTAIAHAIRAKTGKTEALTLDEMAIEITNISSGGETERSLKKLLDATKSTSSLFHKFSGSSITEYMLYEDTSNVTNMSSMFSGCTNLTTVPLLDTSKATSMSSMFGNCKNLTGCYIRNIKVNLTVGSGTSYGHLLTVESLVYLSNELVNVNSSRVLTIGSANLEKITSVYVKLIDITDEMRAEDHLIDSKLPCVVCESTDEGAMLLSEYTLLKKWTLK